MYSGTSTSLTIYCMKWKSMSLALLNDICGLSKTLRGKTWNFESLFGIGGLAGSVMVIFWLRKLMRLKIFTLIWVTVNAITVYISLFLGIIEYKKDNICVSYHYDTIITFWQILWTNLCLPVKLTKQHSIFNCEVKTWMKKIWT